MSWALNNITVPDQPNASSTLINLPFPSKINLDVYNAAILWQLNQVTSPSGLSTEGTWGEPVFMAPGSRSLFRPGVRGIRIWNAVAGAPAQATVEAVQ